MDDIEKKILSEGFIQNETIYRKWITPEFLRYTENCDTKAFAKRFIMGTPYSYVWTTITQEAKALSKQKRKDERFWNKHVFHSIAKDALAYETNTRAIRYLHQIIHEEHYDKMHYLMKEFTYSSEIPSATPKPKAWTDAFLSCGVWHTMQNLILFDKNLSVSEKKRKLDRFSKDMKCKSGQQLFHQTYVYINNPERRQAYE